MFGTAVLGDRSREGALLDLNTNASSESLYAGGANRLVRGVPGVEVNIPDVV